MSTFLSRSPLLSYIRTYRCSTINTILYISLQDKIFKGEQWFIWQQILNQLFKYIYMYM